MAWIYFQELVESDSHSNLGSEQLHTVSENSMHKAYYCPECNQVKLTLPQSGMMSQHCAEKCSLKSTSSSEDSRAKTLVLQDMEKVWQESEAVFSSRLSAWSKKSHPHSSFWKTCQPSELAVFLKSSMPLQKSGMIVDGLVYLPQALEHLTKEKDGSCSLIPTPCARDWKDTGRSPSEMKRNSVTLASIAMRYPTPTCRDAANKPMPPRKYNPSGGQKPPLLAVIGGALNPQWVEWLMGYPTEYTGLNASVMEWFRSKSKRRSKN